MLTVLNKTPLGTEDVFEASNVHFMPVEGADLSMPWASNPAQLGSLTVRGPDSDLLELTSGLVYVMNSAGNTVSKYDLGGWKK